MLLPGSQRAPQTSCFALWQPKQFGYQTSCAPRSQEKLQPGACLSGTQMPTIQSPGSLTSSKGRGDLCCHLQPSLDHSLSCPLLHLLSPLGRKAQLPVPVPQLHSAFGWFPSIFTMVPSSPDLSIGKGEQLVRSSADVWCHPLQIRCKDRQGVHALLPCGIWVGIWVGSEPCTSQKSRGGAQLVPCYRATRFICLCRAACLSTSIIRQAEAAPLFAGS